MQYDHVKSVGCQNCPIYSFLCWATSAESRRFSASRPQQVLQKCIHTAKILPTFYLPPMVCSQRKGKERYLTKQRVKMGSVSRSRITNFSMNSTKLCSYAPSILCARLRQQCLSWQLQLSLPLRPTCHSIASSSAISAGHSTMVRQLVLSTAALVTATMCANLRDSTSWGKSHCAEKCTFPARQLRRCSWNSSRRRGKGVRSAIMRRSQQAGQLAKYMRLTPCDSIPVRSGAGSYCCVMSFSCCMEQQLSRKVRLRASPRLTRGMWTACRQMSSRVLGCGLRQNLHLRAQSLFYRNLDHSWMKDRSVLMKQGRSGEIMVTMFLMFISSTSRERKRLWSQSFSTPANRICRLGCRSFPLDLLPWQSFLRTSPLGMQSASLRVGSGAGGSSGRLSSRQSLTISVFSSWSMSASCFLRERLSASMRLEQSLMNCSNLSSNLSQSTAERASARSRSQRWQNQLCAFFSFINYESNCCIVIFRLAEQSASRIVCTFYLPFPEVENR